MVAAPIAMSQADHGLIACPTSAPVRTAVDANLWTSAVEKTNDDQLVPIMINCSDEHRHQHVLIGPLAFFFCWAMCIQGRSRRPHFA